MAARTAGEAGRSKADVPHHDGNPSKPSDAVSDGKTAWKGTVTFSPALILTRASSFSLSPWLPAFLSLGHGRELEAALEFPEVNIDQFPAFSAKAVEILFDA